MAADTPNVEDAKRSLYDPDETPEEDLWFLPGVSEDRVTKDMLLPTANRRRLEMPDVISSNPPFEFSPAVSGSDDF